uniref:Uncharacterized protein MANES_04G074400 n=1 Tax=Rhizophora mucronata TaxID=61149 RepID=A0A2P2MVD6_RHIMU
MGAGWERVGRERVVGIEGVAAEAVMEMEEELAAAAAAVEERRERLWERVVGREEEDAGAVEEASARLRLRVSIQEPNRPNQIRGRDHAAPDRETTLFI